jgi:hypothetical protein
MVARHLEQLQNRILKVWITNVSILVKMSENFGRESCVLKQENTKQMLSVRSYSQKINSFLN